MVDFFEDTERNPTGPCRQIMRRQGDFIREMIEMTEDTGREYISNIILMDGEMRHTEPRKGGEVSLKADTVTQSMMDGMGLASDMKRGHGNVNTNEYNRYEVHTHPNGFAGLSARDLESFIEKLVGDGGAPEGSFTASKTEEGIVLGGYYRDSELKDGWEGDLNRELTMVADDQIAYMDPKNTDDITLANALEDVGFKFCAVSFPKR